MKANAGAVGYTGSEGEWRVKEDKGEGEGNNEEGGEGDSESKKGRRWRSTKMRVCSSSMFSFSQTRIQSHLRFLPRAP